MRRALLRALVVWLVPVPVYAQDATVLVVLATPPLLITPLLTALIRSLWMRRTSGSGRSTLLLGILEFLLWLLVIWFAAVVYFQDDWLAILVVAPLLLIIVALNRWLARPRPSWMASMARAAVFPTVWLLVQVVWYGAFIAWQ